MNQAQAPRMHATKSVPDKITGSEVRSVFTSLQIKIGDGRLEAGGGTTKTEIQRDVRGQRSSSYIVK